jgi:hypothetical protein
MSIRRRRRLRRRDGGNVVIIGGRRFGRRRLPPRGQRGRRPVGTMVRGPVWRGGPVDFDGATPFLVAGEASVIGG